MEKLITEQNADKTKDIFVGVWRPPLHDVLKELHKRKLINPDFLNTREGCRGNIDESGRIGGFFHDEARVKECWLMGDFDSHLYKRIVE